MCFRAFSLALLLLFALPVWGADEEQTIGSIILRYAKKASRGQLIGIRGPCIGERTIRVDAPADEDWIADHLI